MRRRTWFARQPASSTGPKQSPSPGRTPHRAQAAEVIARIRAKYMRNPGAPVAFALVTALRGRVY